MKIIKLHLFRILSAIQHFQGSHLKWNHKRKTKRTPGKNLLAMHVAPPCGKIHILHQMHSLVERLWIQEYQYPHCQGGWRPNVSSHRQPEQWSILERANNVKYNIVKSFKSILKTVQYNSKSSSLYSRAVNSRKHIRKDYKIDISSSPGSFVLCLFSRPIWSEIWSWWDCIWLHQRHWTERELTLYIMNIGTHRGKLQFNTLLAPCCKLLATFVIETSQLTFFGNAMWIKGIWLIAFHRLYSNKTTKGETFCPESTKCLVIACINFDYFLLFNTSSFCLGRPTHCHRVLPLPPEQQDLSHH